PVAAVRTRDGVLIRHVRIGSSTRDAGQDRVMRRWMRRRRVPRARADGAGRDNADADAPWARDDAGAYAARPPGRPRRARADDASRDCAGARAPSLRARARARAARPDAAKARSPSGPRRPAAGPTPAHAPAARREPR